MTSEPQKVIRFRETAFPRDAVCADCEGTIPAREKCYRLIDATRDYPVICSGCKVLVYGGGAS